MSNSEQVLPVFTAFERRETRVETVYQNYLIALEQAGFDGDIDGSYSGRLIAATDNSVYQQLPQAVLYPRTTAAVQQAFSLAQQEVFRSIKFSPRGGGTGTNGQSLTAGIVVDLSRYFNHVYDVDAKARTVRCQTGVVKDALNDAVRSHGLFFSPDLSTSNRATIGGMINTDASGQGSLVYGKTSDHILELTAVLLNGECITTAPKSLAEAERIAAGTTLEAAIYRQAIATCVGQRAAIEDKFPPLNRFLTGYDLKHCYHPERQEIDISRLLAGSEGTLACIVEAKLNLTLIPRYKVLVNVKYSDFQAALRNAPFLVQARATSVETIDSNVLELARNDIIWHQVAEQLQDVPEQPMRGINMVEFTAVDQAEIKDKVDWLTKTLDNLIAEQPELGVIGYQVCEDANSIQTIYAMRKKAVGLLGATKGRRKPVAFAEDTAVPPEKLADFIAEFRALLDSYNLHYGMFGHVDAGVLHVRPALDMTDPEDEQLLRQISDRVAALTAKYGGLMWGEHGKGYRSEYAPSFFGDTLYKEIQKIKAVFDPDNRLNPGKICTPWGSNAQLVSVDATKRGYYDRQIPITVRDDYQAAMNCNGNGLCFNYAADSAMCPSFKATGDRRNSPKGRATLIREWLRLNAAQQFDPSGFPQKSRFEILKQVPSAEKFDFNHEVKAAMDSCLACKACASQCPVKVDVPSFRAKFLAWYYNLYRRPSKDYLVKNVESLGSIMAKWPRLSNLLSHNPLSTWVTRQWFGYLDAPKLSVPSVAARWQANNWPQLTEQELAELSPDERQHYVVVVQDPFTSFYDAGLLEAFGKIASQLGFKPVLLAFKGNGKAQHVKGFLNEFSQTVDTVVEQLNQVAAVNLPMVGLDASTVLCLHDEYRDYAKQPLRYNVQLVQQWLLQVLPKRASALATKTPMQTLQLLSHCTEQTAMPKAAKEWQQIFNYWQIPLHVEATGCCGMAGTFGHELENQQVSQKLYDMSWRSKVEKAEVVTLATGFSCRSQVKRMSTKKRALHPLQWLAENCT
jgi:FAD/FMN-containing dehydrogenases